MKLFVKGLLSILALFFLFGCAAKQSTMPTFDTKTFNKNMYASKVDNFIILFDASSSMSQYYNGPSKFDIARAVVYGMNETLPELGQTAGLRSFGHSPDVSPNKTELFYGMEKYATRKLADNFTKITKPGGFSPLYLALDAASNDLDGLSGEMNAVIMISDGLDLPGDVLASAKALKEKFGDSICFFPILVGNDKKGEALLKGIADIGKCGFLSSADDLLSYAGMAEFVEMVFLTERVGVDTDKDGVDDADDKCPGTPLGAKVNAVGCWALENVLFDFDKDIIKAAAYPLLDDVVKILEKNPAMGVELHGHCDNVGTAEYNMDLSMRRAKAVKAYLVSKGILKNRLATEAYGFTKPLALNGTAEGRAINRRVELHPY